MQINIDKNYMELERTLESLYKTVEPLYSLSDSISALMDKTGNLYFRLPAHKSTDGQDHYFYFKVSNDNYLREDRYTFSHYT